MPTSPQSHINQSCENVKNDLWLAGLIFSTTHLSLSLSTSISPLASFRPSPSVSDSSLVCCQSSYMSEQAAVHSSRTLLCTQGIPSPVSSPPLALCFCLRRPLALGLSIQRMPSPLLLTLRLQSVGAQVQSAVAYFAPCGAFLSFHMLLLSQSARQPALWACCLQKSLAHTKALKELFRDYRNPYMHEPTPENRGFYCVLGLVRLALKCRPLPASIWLSQVWPYPWPWDFHLFALAVVNIVYYLNSASRPRHSLFVPDPQLNHNST